MSLDLLKKEAASLPAAERRSLIAFLFSMEQMEEEGYREKLAAKIDDQTPGRFLFLEEMDEKLRLSS